MALTPVPEEDLGRGVDFFHPENRLPPGFVEDARNFDATAAGTLRKRVGYQAYAGYLPLRVQAVQILTNTLLISLDVPDGATASLRSSSIVIKGRAESTVGPFGIAATPVQTTYDGFTVVDGTTISVPFTAANTAQVSFEGCIWGIRVTDLDFSEADNPEYSTQVDMLAFFRNSTTQHPVAAYRGALYSGSASSLSRQISSPTLVMSVLGTPSFTVVSGNAITLTGHPFLTGQLVTVASTGTLPTGLVAGTSYYVIRVDANTIRLATSYLHSLSGTFITITGSGTGSRTVRPGVVLAPLFIDSDDISPRSRGHISSDGADVGWVRGTNIAYNTGTGFVELTLTLPDMTLRRVDGTVEPSLAALVSAGLDVISIRDASFTALNADHRIQAITNPVLPGDTLVVSVSIPTVTSVDSLGLPDGTADFRAGVFSDMVRVSGTDVALGDRIYGAQIPETELPYLVSKESDGGVDTLAYIGPVSDPLPLQNGTLLARERFATQFLQLPVLTVSGPDRFVRGDMVWWSDLPASRRIRVQNVCPWTETLVMVTSDGVTGTINTGSVTIGNQISVGDLLSLGSTQAAFDAYDGIVTVTAVVGALVSFDTTDEETGGSYWLRGQGLGISEAVDFFMYDDAGAGTTIYVPERWQPVEAISRPLTTSPNQTYVTYYTTSEDSGPHLKFRHATVGESLYFGNDVDGIFKYDGVNIMKAGIPRWPSLQGVSQVSDRTSGIVNLSVRKDVADAVAPTTGIYDLGTGNASSFQVDQTVMYSARQTGITPLFEYEYDVTDTNAATSNAANTARYLTVTPNTASAFFATADFFTPPVSRQYYVSVYRKDANGDVAIGSPYHTFDSGVRFGDNHRIDLQLTQIPLFPLYDWRRVESHVAATFDKDGTPSYVLASIVPVTYTSVVPCRVFQDGIQPADLPLRQGITNTSLQVLNNLQGSALKASLEPPPQARTMTNAASRLVLGNITSSPRATVTAFVPAGASATPSDLVGQAVSIADSAGTTAYRFVGVGANGQAASNSVNVSGLRVTDMDGTYVTLTNNSTFATSASPITGVAAGNWIQIFEKTTSRESSRHDSFLFNWFRIVSVTGDQVIRVAAPHRAKRQAAVDPASDHWTLVDHGLNTGDPVRLTLGTGGAGVLPAGTTATDQYYARVITPDTFTLHLSFVDACSGAAVVNATGPGTLPFYLMYVEQPTTSGFAFSSTTPDLSTVPVAVWDLSITGAANGIVTLTDVDTRMKTVADKIPSRDLMLSTCIKELGRAINAAASAKSFTPAPTTTSPYAWCAAYGNDASGPSNTLELEGGTSVTITFGTAPTPTWYVEGNVVASGIPTNFVQKRMPSRLAVSYPNFPEVFDQPFVQLASFSDSAIDVGENDGDEITAVIPRFGESFSNAAQGQGSVLVFKNYSAYIVDVNNKTVAQIETNGQGCTYPRSVTRSKNGVVFANEAGLWKINEGNQCVFLGQVVTRYWEDVVNRDADADVIVGIHDARRNRVMISVPVDDGTSNSDIVTYDHTKENSDDRGPWMPYGNYAATCWSNIGPDLVFGTTTGQVFSLRRAGDPTDYQDDVDPVGGLDEAGTPIGAYVVFGDKSFGAEGIRKRCNYIDISFRQSAGVVVSRDTCPLVQTAVNHTHVFEDLDDFVLADPAAGTYDNLSGTRRGYITSLLYSVPASKGEYMQLRVSDVTVSRPVEIASVTYLVSPLQQGGVPSAGESR